MNQQIVKKAVFEAQFVKNYIQPNYKCIGDTEEELKQKTICNHFSFHKTCPWTLWWSLMVQVKTKIFVYRVSGSFDLIGYWLVLLSSSQCPAESHPWVITHQPVHSVIDPYFTLTQEHKPPHSYSLTHTRATDTCGFLTFSELLPAAANSNKMHFI